MLGEILTSHGHRHRKYVYRNPLPSDNQHKSNWTVWRVIKIFLLIFLGYTMGVMIPAIHEVLNYR